MRQWVLSATICSLVSCSIMHQELPNEPPEVQVSSVDTTQVRRGGVVSFEVRASDEDDDPLLYTWRDFGAGAFSDTTDPETEWTAPLYIQSNSEIVLVTVTISDRQPDTEDIVESFLIEVIQSPPSLITSTTDTTVNFRTPVIVLEATGNDDDGDPITFAWDITEGAQLYRDDPEIGQTKAEITPLFPGNYTVLLEISDGQDTVRSEILLHVPEPVLPQSGMIALEIPREDGSVFPYEIDVYEYPNQKGELPLLTGSWFEAARLCEEQGKRLCSQGEWQWACQGPEALMFSSTDKLDNLPSDFGRRYCNYIGSEIAGQNPQIEDLAPSGYFPNCSSSTNVYDLTGNAFEWTMDFNAFLERTGGFMFSGVSTDLGCSLGEQLESIPDEINIYSDEDIAELDRDPKFSGYLLGEKIRGFRCCR